ncbi:MAG: alkane 1-monooxygenase [Deltaproteobacteria bacterium]|nr:MAG: alkane 1-monooxygenase [Deltaproteobacteria bacterium]
MTPVAYLAALVPGLLALSGLWLDGLFAWATPLFVFGAVPILDQVLPRQRQAHPRDRSRAERWLTDALLFATVPLQILALLALLWRAPGMDPVAWLGNTLSVGILLGVYGLNVGHELGHRRGRLGRRTAILLMSSSLYGHFWIEHNLGHHTHVATPRDPASAGRGQILYPFWIRSIVGGARSAYTLAPRFVLGCWLGQALALGVVFWWFGPLAGLTWLTAATVGILLLETVNFVEHYGLRRDTLPDGRYERVKPRHSWNAEHLAGRSLLFDLPRHSDHHANPQRPCTSLRYVDEAPQLPLGYPAMILLALVPPLFQRMVHPELDRALAAEPPPLVPSR